MIFMFAHPAVVLTFIAVLASAFVAWVCVALASVTDYQPPKFERESLVRVRRQVFDWQDLPEYQ